MKSRQLLLAISVIIVPALAGAQTSTSQSPSSSYEKEVMAAHEGMMSGMQMKPSGNPDKDFAMMMIPHHQGAIDMARVELKYGKDSELRDLAEKIISAQQKEIGQLNAWLAKMK